MANGYDIEHFHTSSLYFHSPSLDFHIPSVSLNLQELSPPALIAILFAPRSYLVWSTKYIPCLFLISVDGYLFH